MKKTLYGIGSAVGLAGLLMSCEKHETGLVDKELFDRSYSSAEAQSMAGYATGQLKDLNQNGVFDSYTLTTGSLSPGAFETTYFLSRLPQSPEPLEPHERIYMVNEGFFADAKNWESATPPHVVEKMAEIPNYGP